jgi:PAS domain S-box-containing protein
VSRAGTTNESASERGLDNASRFGEGAVELAQRQLEEMRDLFQGTLDSLAADVAVVDEHGVVVMANRAWSQGESPIERAGVGVDYVAVCEASKDLPGERVAADLREIMAGTRTRFQLEYACQAATPTRWFVMRAARSEGAGPLRVVISHMEVTERKSVELALIRGRDHLLAVTNSMGEGVFTVDSAGQLTYLNKAAEELLGWRPQTILGHPIYPWVHGHRLDGSALPSEECVILRAIGEGEVVRSPDALFTRSDGSLLEVSFTGAPLLTESGSDGCVVVFADITERKAKERLIEMDLDKLAWVSRVQEALSEDLFVLHAQPIIDLATGALAQRELLIRMRQPVHSGDASLIAPSSFLPVAEEFGQIGEIDRWVIDRAAEIAAKGFPVQLNVSGHTVADARFIGYIERAIERTGADPRTMVFEITETTLISNEAAASMFVERLHQLGCKIALDDFGTGYGGFTYVKHLPIDFLKIDIEFVRDLRENPASRSVIEAIVQLAQGFGLKTIGEGVEDTETMQLLRELSVDYAQGFHIGRPGPLASVYPEQIPETIIP